jgi:hypothetical protein
MAGTVQPSICQECASGVNAMTKSIVYAIWNQPVGGGNLYKPITAEVLENWGWMSDLSADLTKIEDTRTLKDRPNCDGWQWWDIKDPKVKEKDLDAFLAEKPELNKYIKDFIGTLNADDVKKYGGCIKKRLCMPPAQKFGESITWIKVDKLPESAHGFCFLPAEGDGSHDWLIHPNGEAAFGVWGGSQVKPKPEVGKWKHVAVTFDGTTLTGYANGEKVQSVAATFALKGVPLTVVQPHLGENGFEGQFDDLRVHDRALSAAEVADLARRESK